MAIANLNAHELMSELNWKSVNAEHDALCLRYYGSADVDADPKLSAEEFRNEHSKIHQQLRTTVPQTP